MFTGIIEALGQVRGLRRSGGAGRLEIHGETLALDDVRIGDSIAVNGVCLTVTECLERGFTADVSPETLALTTLGQLQSGDAVNLEKALPAGGRLDGHLVTGHVDGTGELVSMQRQGEGRSLRFRVPGELSRYVARKGSICVDGVSLTVNGVDGDHFEVMVIPHTMEQTTMQYYRPGRAVNLEVDIIARYLERLLERGDSPAQAAGEGLSRELLARHGYGSW